MSALLLSSTHSLWTDICTVDDILPGTGVCALVADQHVAVFRTSDDQFFAIDNVDPKSGASVLSRGLIVEVGTDPETGGWLFRTSELFLERMGLQTLDELPSLAPLLPELDGLDGDEL